MNFSQTVYFIKHLTVSIAKRNVMNVTSHNKTYIDCRVHILEKMFHYDLKFFNRQTKNKQYDTSFTVSSDWLAY